MSKFNLLPKWIQVIVIISATPFVAAGVAVGYVLFMLLSGLYTAFSWPWKVVLGIPFIILGGGMK